jgi:hypothetical protein
MPTAHGNLKYPVWKGLQHEKVFPHHMSFGPLLTANQ